MNGLGDLHLDRVRAIKAAAGVVLAVLGISLLPGLMAPAEPEPLPADVGFRPSENLAVAPVPVSGRTPDTGARAAREEMAGKRAGRAKGRSRDRSERSPRRNAPNAHRTRERRPSEGDRVRPEPTAPPVVESTSPSPAPVWTPAPASRPPVPPPVDDGSVEFAPR